MSSQSDRPSCPHCGMQLRELRLPDDAAYASAVHLVCFNDDCCYYRDGWAWMREKYSINASYRYRLDPVSHTASPLPVWSESALRDRILDAVV